MTDDLLAWLTLLLRWTHVFAAIMWVGQTYFFTWMDGRFTELEQQPDASDPSLWLVHSGGFYVVRKQKVPQLMSMRLHWFKWEAAVTWLSGLSLLTLVYYAGGLLLDAAYGEWTSIAIGLGVILVAWLVYDSLWNSPLAANETLAVGVSFLLVVGLVVGLLQVFGGRTAYIHVGAVFGTIMTANVWVRIIPGQQRLVQALMDGRTPDLRLAAIAKARSKHNTFIVVPTVFVMISNHYPTVSYGTQHAWIVMSVLVLGGWAAAHLLRRA